MYVRTETEAPVFTLHGSNRYSHEHEEVKVSWNDLHSATLGAKWVALDRSNCVRASRNEEATVIFKDKRGCAVLHRRWGTTDEQQPENWEQVELVWYEFCK